MTLPVVSSPTVLRLPAHTRDKLEKYLKYRDLRVEHEIKRHKSAIWFKKKFGEEAWKDRLEELQTKRQGNLFFEDEQGFWTYSGLREEIAYQLGTSSEFSREYLLPEPSPFPWKDGKPPKTPRDYQLQAKNALLGAAKYGPAAVEISTGLGKSWVIVSLLRDLGLPAVVMAPSVSIFEQLRVDMVSAFGKAAVGSFGDGKKDLNKRFVVAIAASLTRVKPDTPEWESLHSRGVFIADESHLVAADTLASICLGVMKSAPYRFSFSGTQLRADGLGKLLTGITGPVVFEMTLRQGVDAGWLAKPVFTMVSSTTPSSRVYGDSNEETRAHLYYNARVNAQAGELANRCVNLLQRPTLILIEEVEQFGKLLPHLRHNVGFAHGGLNKDNRGKVPERYHKSDPMALVAEFNAGRLPILVGTSCIGTGTDVRAAEAIIYLQGGKSEIQVRQAIGRGTRGGTKFGLLNPWTNEQKTDCLVFDFDVGNCETAHRHAEARAHIYEEMYGPVQYEGRSE